VSEYLFFLSIAVLSTLYRRESKGDKDLNTIWACV